MQYLYFGVFMLITLIHLYACVKSEFLRTVTKGLLLLSLLGFYLECSRAGSFFGLPVKGVRWEIAAALLLSCLGDMLLLGEGSGWFSFGGTAFGAAHLLLIWVMITLTPFASVSLAAVIIPAVLIAALSVWLYLKLFPDLPKELRLPMFPYELANGAMMCFALYRLFADPGFGAAAALFGTVIFSVSDDILFISMFRKDTKIKNLFGVMFTYISGMFFIVLGLSA